MAPPTPPDRLAKLRSPEAAKYHKAQCKLALPPSAPRHCRRLWSQGLSRLNASRQVISDHERPVGLKHIIEPPLYRTPVHALCPRQHGRSVSEQRLLECESHGDGRIQFQRRGGATREGVSDSLRGLALDG